MTDVHEVLLRNSSMRRKERKGFTVACFAFFAPLRFICAFILDTS